MYSHIISVTKWCFFNHTFNHSLLSTTKGFNQSCSGNVAIIWGNQYFLIQLFISMLISNWNLTSHWKSWRWIMWMSCTLIVYSYLFFKKFTEQNILFRFIDWNLRGIAQVMFVNNSFSGIIILAGLIMQNPWWALNGIVGTMFSTLSAVLLGQNR